MSATPCIATPMAFNMQLAANRVHLDSNDREFLSKALQRQTGDRQHDEEIVQEHHILVCVLPVWKGGMGTWGGGLRRPVCRKG